MENKDRRENYKIIISIDNFYIKGFIFFDGQVLSSKKISLVQEFFNPLFDRVLFINKFIKVLLYNFSYHSPDDDLNIEIYTSLDFFKKDLLKITEKVINIDQNFLNDKTKYFAKKFYDIPCFVVNVSRDNIFISGNINFTSSKKTFDFMYDELFKIKDFSQFSILNGKIKKYNLYNSLTKQSLSYREELFLPIISTLNKNLLSSFSFEPQDSVPIFILSGDIYQFLSDSNYAIFSLLYGLDIRGIISLYTDNSNIFPFLGILPDDYIFSKINHIGDVFHISFDKKENESLIIPIKVIDDESVKEINVKLNDLINIPVNGTAHITIKLPNGVSIGNKRGDVELISKSKVFIYTKDIDKLTPIEISRWIENSQDLVF